MAPPADEPVREECACVHIRDFPAWAWHSVLGRDDIAVIERGRVCARTDALRLRGLQNGVRADRARPDFPDVLFQPRAPALELAAWHTLLDELALAAPHIRVLEPGCAVLVPWDRQRFLDILRLNGVRGGEADCQNHALLAALAAEAGSLRRWDERLPAAFPLVLLAELDFAGDMLQRLGLFGLATLADVMRLQARHLIAQFGADGKRLAALLHGLDESPVPIYVPPRTIGEQHIFEDGCIDMHALTIVLGNLTARAVERLQGCLCAQLTVVLDGNSATRLLPQPASGAEYIRRIALEQLRRMQPEAAVCRLALRLGSLVLPDAAQHNLFDTGALEGAVRNILRRYPCAVQRIVAPEYTVLPEESRVFESWQ